VAGAPGHDRAVGEQGGRVILTSCHGHGIPDAAHDDRTRAILDRAVTELAGTVLTPRADEPSFISARKRPSRPKCHDR
jgi:hypothetical protein